MNRMPELDKSRKKRSIAIRLDLCQWVEEQIGKGRFHNVSHAVEIAVDELRESEKEKKKKTKQAKRILQPS